MWELLRSCGTGAWSCCAPRGVLQLVAATESRLDIVVRACRIVIKAQRMITSSRTTRRHPKSKVERQRDRCRGISLENIFILRGVFGEGAGASARLPRHGDVFGRQSGYRPSLPNSSRFVFRGA